MRSPRQYRRTLFLTAGLVTVVVLAMAPGNGRADGCDAVAGKEQALRRACRSKCLAGARAGTLAASDCNPPYNGTMLDCIRLADSWSAAAQAAGCPVRDVGPRD